ncbi:MAG TPA: right-handed parallel beta-helix repeat-containing protein, partial [Pirellulaceae bacterium]
DSGVRIEGPSFVATTLPPVATFDRGNTLPGNYVIEMAGADDATIDRLGLTGATVGVYGSNSADSDRLTLTNNDIYGHSYQIGGSGPHGIYLDQGNDDAFVSGNRVHNNTAPSGAGNGITVNSPRARVTNNEVYGQQVGIAVGYNGSLLTNDWVQVTGNTVRDHSGIGVDAYLNALVTGNTVYGQSSVNGVGIFANQVTAMDNLVYGNTTGIVADRALVKHNRTHSNTTGIAGRAYATIEANQSYSNAVGISGDASGGFYGLIANNLVYGNTSRGISIDLSFNAGLQIINNTVFQAVGDGIRLQNVSQGSTLRNNVVTVDAGYDIYVSPNSQAGFSSNYNLFHQGTDPNAHVGFWGGVIRDSLADWQTATGQDGNSLANDPQFVDQDGPDNVLGFTTSGGGYDGGLDDNFHLRGGSPAIDRADSALAPTLDRDGNTRFDDPGTTNAGVPAGLAFVDLGAFEFQGNSADLTPPSVLSSSIQSTGTSSNPTRQVLVTLSEPLEAFDALGLAHYELRAAGGNGSFDDGDDMVFTLVPQYASGSTHLTLTVTNGTSWPAGLYRLTVRGSLHDRSGNALDGDSNGSAGGNYVRTNNRPDLAAIGNQVVSEQQLLSFTASAADDGPVTYSLASGAPTGAAIDPTTGIFSWTP